MKHKLTKSVTFHRLDDAAILEKLEREGKFKKGAWSPFVRALIRQWAAGPTFSPDPEAVRQIVREEVERRHPVNGNGGPVSSSLKGTDPSPAAIHQAIAQALDERKLSLQFIRQAMEGVVRSAPAIEDDGRGRTPAEADDADWFETVLDEALV
jgi:hypothetical protein